MSQIWSKQIHSLLNMGEEEDDQKEIAAYLTVDTCESRLARAEERIKKILAC